VIYTYSESADPVQHQQAWAAAFVLIMFVLVTSLTSRFILHRSRRKLLTGRSGRGVIGLLRSFWVRGD
jgi:hypothetical protein